ncbi:uncharacterized protein B4U80_00203 [Leptotrombidium deliense]|uniref:Uncharacterized protein n=1 Tax=Leptotrombidium deliense TaxID=299467 RepID=A0A443SKD1_9ACAR|nr:uncharacterized protein B4U80_00203 [Leptotrombidium deliense]
MINKLKLEIEKLSHEADQLRLLYTKRDKILDLVFEGQYGSDLENKLERELDWLTEQRHQVDQANFRWKQAQLHTKDACRLLSEAIKNWKTLIDISERDSEKRYICTNQVRNKLVESIQNLQIAQNYLPNISFPYCNSDEVQTLEKAISYIFTDMQTQDRFQHALSCYETTLKRTAALRQWLEQVLNSTIARDLYEISEDCKVKSAELRAERIRLIKQRVKDTTGKDIDSIGEMSLEMRDSGVDSELEESLADEQLARLFDSRDGRRTTSLTPNPTKTPFYLPTPLPSGDLAPIPSNEQIFGKIQEVRNRHRQEILDFQRAQKMNQIRMMQGLKSKLAERRHRRSRMEMHNRELQALSETP